MQTTLFIHKPFTCNQESLFARDCTSHGKVLFPITSSDYKHVRKLKKQASEERFFLIILNGVLCFFFFRRFFFSHYVNEVFSISYSRLEQVLQDLATKSVTVCFFLRKFSLLKGQTGHLSRFCQAGLKEKYMKIHDYLLLVIL